MAYTCLQYSFQKFFCQQCPKHFIPQYKSFQHYLGGGLSGCSLCSSVPEVSVKTLFLSPGCLLSHLSLQKMLHHSRLFQKSVCLCAGWASCTVHVLFQLRHLYPFSPVFLLLSLLFFFKEDFQNLFRRFLEDPLESPYKSFFNGHISQDNPIKNVVSPHLCLIIESASGTLAVRLIFSPMLITCRENSPFPFRYSGPNFKQSSQKLFSRCFQNK